MRKKSQALPHFMFCVSMLMMEMLCPHLQGGEVVVQSSSAPPKTSTTIEVGQRFQCKSDIRLRVYQCPIWLRAGTIGLRMSESEFYIAKGNLRVGALPPAPRFGFSRAPLKFRFQRGVLQATGLEWLTIREDGEIRWLKEAATGLSEITLDGLSFMGQAETLLIASERKHLILGSASENGFDLDDLEKKTFSELVLRNNRLRDAEASLSTRMQILEPWFFDSIFKKEKRLSARRGRRYGDMP